MSSESGAVAGEVGLAQELVPKLRFPEFREAGAWTTRALSEFATLIDERVGARSFAPFSITSGVGLVSQQDKFGRSIAGQQLKNYFVIRDGDFAYNKSATKEYPQGFAVMFTNPEPGGVPSSIFSCFSVTDEEISKPYFNYLLQGNLHGRWLSRFLTIGARANGSLNIDDRDLMSLPVPLPAGALASDEQRKIAAFLSSLDTLIQTETDKQAALRDHKIGLMQQIFPVEGETTPRLRFPKFRDAGDWEEKPIGVACHLYQPETLSTSNLDPNGKFPVYGANGIIGRLDRYNHEHSEVAVTCRGATCGEVLQTQPMSWINGNAMVVRPRNDGLTKDFLFQFLKDDGLQSIVSGSAQPQITRAGFSPLLIRYPKEFEQRQIVECLSSADRLRDESSGKLQALKSYKAGLMQQLFPAPNEASA